MSTKLPLVTNLSSRVIRILGCNPGPMTLQGTNSYLIGTGKDRILLDTSDEDKTEYVDELRNILQKLDVRVETVLLSHWHHDHVGCIEAIQNDQNIKANRGCSFYKMPRTDVDEEQELFSVKISPLKDGQKFLTEGATLRAVFTPGHTTDHTAFLLEEENAIFTADCVLGEGTTVLEKLADYMKSLYILKDLKAEVLYPGHGPHNNDPEALIGKYISHREGREKQIIESLQRSDLTIEEIVRTVYAGLPENLILAATQNVHQHLEKLMEEGLVVEVGEKYHLKQNNKL
ncbi:endoribonuclease LACTB2 [Neocloeon triangulifer]|uniref:endoribonuclease LACTB2 n=1 Tax=Neocloeon triangulifer TaxID=2078957 RepID=UPI00286FAC65|nr:endoribonuclease LACTB2 [Neocloeon triangulifer]